MGKDAHDLKSGEEVSWAWGAGHPKGKVMEVKDGELHATSKNGNDIVKHGSSDDPAVKIKANSGSEAVKLAHELDGVEGEK